MGDQKGVGDVMQHIADAVSKVRRLTLTGSGSDSPGPAEPRHSDARKSDTPSDAHQLETYPSVSRARRLILFGQAHSKQPRSSVTEGSSDSPKTSSRRSSQDGRSSQNVKQGSQAKATVERADVEPRKHEDPDAKPSSREGSSKHPESSSRRKRKESVEYTSPNDSTVHRYLALETLGYDVCEQIGKGSYALVRKATHLQSGRIVAIKIVSKARCPSDFLNKFLPRELAALRILRHPNLITVYNITESQSRFYIIMDLAARGDLLEKIRKHRRLTEHHAGKYFSGLVSGMIYVHGQNIVHRDLKCENILLDAKDNVRITDFGFSRSVWTSGDKVAMCTTFCGSFAYAAPEVLKSKPYDPFKSDVWSMGVILYTMVTGKLPFDDKDHKRLLELVHQPVRFPESVITSPEFRDCVRDILVPNPLERIRLQDIPEQEWFTSFAPALGYSKLKPDHNGSSTEPSSNETDTSSSNSSRKLLGSGPATLAVPVPLSRHPHKFRVKIGTRLTEGCRPPTPPLSQKLNPLVHAATGSVNREVEFMRGAKYSWQPAAPPLPPASRTFQATRNAKYDVQLAEEDSPPSASPPPPLQKLHVHEAAVLRTEWGKDVGGSASDAVLAPEIVVNGTASAQNTDSHASSGEPAGTDSGAGGSSTKLVSSAREGVFHIMSGEDEGYVSSWEERPLQRQRNLLRLPGESGGSVGSWFSLGSKSSASRGTSAGSEESTLRVLLSGSPFSVHSDDQAGSGNDSE